MQLFNDETFERLSNVMRTAQENGSPRAYAVTTGNRDGEQRSLTGGFRNEEQTLRVDVNQRVPHRVSH